MQLGMDEEEVRNRTNADYVGRGAVNFERWEALPLLIAPLAVWSQSKLSRGTGKSTCNVFEFSEPLPKLFVLVRCKHACWSRVEGIQA